VTEKRERERERMREREGERERAFNETVDFCNLLGFSLQN
jgi:hypothetical protein